MAAITISKETQKKLQKYKLHHDSYDTIISLLLKYHDENNEEIKLAIHELLTQKYINVYK